MNNILKTSLCALALGALTAQAQVLKLAADDQKAAYIMTSKDTVNVAYAAGFNNVAVMTNVAEYSVEKVTADADWVSFRKEANGNITFCCSYYYDNINPRYATFRLTADGGAYQRELVVKQLPNSSVSEMGDTKLEIASATASASQSGEGIELTYDGNNNTMWHSPYSKGGFPFTLTYTLKEASHVDYLVYTPRSGNENGNFGEVKVEYALATNPTFFHEAATEDLGFSSSASTINFGSEGVDNVLKVRITVKTGKNDFASCAEMTFYQKDQSANMEMAQYFTNDLCYQLKDGVTAADVAGISNPYLRQLASELIKGGYSTEFRVGEFGCYETRQHMYDVYKLSCGYDPYENPTGIYFEAGDQIGIFATGISEDYPVSLCIANFSTAADIDREGQPTSYFPLHNGLNLVKASHRGNAYVSYFADNYAAAPKVKLHFALATESGYFDAARHNNDDYVRLLANVKSPNFDIITQRLHVVAPVNLLRKATPTNGEKLAKIYNEVIYREREIMGMQKYNCEPVNHQIARPVRAGMFADGTGAAAAFGMFDGWIDADNFSYWGIAHELGHNNQINPGFKWSGCGETTNNIYAAWVEHKVGAADNFGTGHHRLEDEVIGIDAYAGKRGGKFQAHLEEGVRKGVSWQLQDGVDYHGTEPDMVTVASEDENGNKGANVTTPKRNYCHFTKVVPFWQLELYTEEVGAAPGAFGTMINSYRNDFDRSKFNTNGKQQIEMMRRFCEAAQINLLPFFEKAGLLKPIKAYIEDYSPGWNIITQAMCDALKQEVAAKNYPEAPKGLNFINAYNWQRFRDKVALTAGTVGNGCTLSDKFVKVDNDAWAGAVGYETYDANGNLLHLSMFGLGDSQMSSRYTFVIFPSNASYIMAVDYKGDKVKIYQK